LSLPGDNAQQIVDAVASAGLADRTDFVIVSDQGFLWRRSPATTRPRSTSAVAAFDVVQPVPFWPSFDALATLTPARRLRAKTACRSVMCGRTRRYPGRRTQA
jgi:hypothetical protein